MSTLSVVEEILRTTGAPISVREIVELAGAGLPSKSKTPDTVVARDLAMDIKRQGERSRFVRTSPGRYSLRELTVAAAPAPTLVVMASAPAPLSTTALKQDRLPAKSTRTEPVRIALRNPVSAG